MPNGLIIVAISGRGVEKIKLYHTEKEKRIFDVYKKLIPYISQIDRVAADKGKRFQTRIERSRQMSLTRHRTYFNQRREHR